MSEIIQIKNINNYTIEIIDNTLILTPKMEPPLPPLPNPPLQTISEEDLYKVDSITSTEQKNADLIDKEFHEKCQKIISTEQKNADSIGDSIPIGDLIAKEFLETCKKNKWFGHK